MREKTQDEENLVIVMDRCDQSVVVLDVENRDRLTAGYLDLVRRWQNFPQIDQVLKTPAANEFFPVIEGRGRWWMTFGIVAQPFDRDDAHGSSEEIVAKKATKSRRIFTALAPNRFIRRFIGSMAPAKAG
jgi:hypothetical protein